VKRTGASLVVHALEQLGVRYTFGIPGVHTVEVYDELNKSEQIRPVLVTHEVGAAFMADAVSRTTGTIGTLMIVPAAGVTHAMSGIGEALLDGIPMLVITGGIRRNTGHHYQLHQIDQGRLAAAVCKRTYLPKTHQEIIPILYEAYDLATSGTPGPVLVEIPSDLQMFAGEVDGLPEYKRMTPVAPPPDSKEIARAAELLKASRHPGILVGWGAREATESVRQIAELLGAPVSTTLQGLSAFPADHPLHVGMGFGAFAVPAAEDAFKDCDCLLAVGVRFSELATGSYSLPVPKNLIHVDINREVFNKNYPAAVAIEGDAGTVLQELLAVLNKIGAQCQGDKAALADRIQKAKQKYLAEWTAKQSDSKVGPGFFFSSLRKKLEPDAYVVVDDGHHTFLAMELLPIYRSGHFISPTDFNSMGYCVPAAVATKLSHPDRQVVGIVGDGALLMTGLELLTAATLNLGVVIFVFYDGKLGQISQFQQIPLNRSTCTVLGEMKVEGIAQATGAAYLAMHHDGEIDGVIAKAFEISKQGQPVLVDVKVDYSKRTRFTKGVLMANFSRFTLGEKVRFIGRSAIRHVLG
jgi:acetolactate synthase I/II/III large subunit